MYSLKHVYESNVLTVIRTNNPATFINRGLFSHSSLMLNSAWSSVIQEISDIEKRGLWNSTNLASTGSDKFFNFSESVFLHLEVRIMVFIFFIILWINKCTIYK